MAEDLPEKYREALLLTEDLPGVARIADAEQLDAHAGRNAMAPALVLLDALANERAACGLPAGRDLTLHVGLAHG